MGIVEQDLPADWGGGAAALPLVLLVPLALVWAYYVLREPKDGNHHGWFVPPIVITIVAGILYAGVSRLA